MDYPLYMKINQRTAQSCFCRMPLFAQNTSMGAFDIKIAFENWRAGNEIGVPLKRDAAQEVISNLHLLDWEPWYWHNHSLCLVTDEKLIIVATDRFQLHPDKDLTDSEADEIARTVKGIFRTLAAFENTGDRRNLSFIISPIVKRFLLIAKFIDWDSSDYVFMPSEDGMIRFISRDFAPSLPDTLRKAAEAMSDVHADFFFGTKARLIERVEKMEKDQFFNLLVLVDNLVKTPSDFKGQNWIIEFDEGLPVRKVTFHPNDLAQSSDVSSIFHNGRRYFYKDDPKECRGVLYYTYLSLLTGNKFCANIRCFGVINGVPYVVTEAIEPPFQEVLFQGIKPTERVKEGIQRLHNRLQALTGIMVGERDLEHNYFYDGKGNFLLIDFETQKVPPPQVFSELVNKNLSELKKKLKYY